MDSESLDRCIQTALSSLYPPFQATSPTVLCQVLSVVESRYRGDGLRYLIHFLLPAKQFLQNIQQDACLQYCGLLFLHEGWPLCVHEKVVVQLCPLDHRLLRPGDFYLLVSPPPSPIPPRAHSASCKSGVTSSPRLLVCSVSAGSHHVEQQEVSELALRSLFSMAWLDSVNREREQRGASRLERCLLSAHGDVFRVPWEDLVYPQFISRPRTTLGEDKESSVKDGDMFINTSHDPCRDTNSPGQDVKLLPSSAKTDQSAASSESEDSEGEYVELTELPLPRFSPQKGSLTQSISLQHRARSSTHPSTHTHTHSAATHTPQNTHTLSAATHTPQNTHTLSAAAHTPQNTHTHSAAAHTPQNTHTHSASTHTPQTPLTHPANTTHSWSCVEVSSQTGLCSRLIEENLSQDSCGPVILTPVSPATASSSSSAHPEVVGTSSCQSERRMSQKEIEGSSSETPPVQSDMSLFTGPSPAEPEQPADRSAAPTVPVQLTQSSQSSFNSVLLRSGVLCLPGTRDRGGRALLTVCTTNAVWSNPDCDSAELLRLLLYYTSTLRKDVRAQGLTVLVDARRAAPVPALFSALEALQDNIPGSIHTVLLLVNKDSSLRLDKPAATQVEVLSSLKSVQKHVELRQLPAEFGGSFSFSQSSWLCFRSRLEQLTNQCEDVINLLQKTINILQSTPLPAAAEEAELLLSRYQAVMRSILEDSRLVQLQQEGGASLSRLRREESSISVTEDYRAAVETVSSLYEQVDELLHRLVTLSNARTQELQFIAEFRNLEQGFTEVRSWLEDVGEVRLKNLDESEDSLELLNKKQQDFKEFYTTAYDRCKHGEVLLSRLERWEDVTSADLHHYEVKVHSFWAQLQDFSQRVKTTGHNIDRAVRLYSFLDQAYGWALEGMRHLAGISMEDCTLPDKCQAVIGCLEDYHRQHPPIPDAHFQEMKAAAGELRGERGLRQWSFAWSKCQETKKMFDRKMEAALRTRDSAHRRRSDSTQSRSSASLSRKTLSGLWGGRETSSSPPEDSVTSSPTSSSSSLLTPQHTPLLQRLFRSVSSDEASDRVDLCSSSPSLPRLNSSASLAPSSPCSSSSSCSSFSSSRRQQLRKTQSFDCPSTPEVSRYGPCPRALSEPVRRGNTGVFIRGLEVSSSEAADHTLCPRTAAHGWAGQGLRSPGTPGTPRTTGSPAADPRPRGSKLRHIVEEMVTTEREYVRSLRYIIHHYFPEMDRADLPQDLRGKRSVVFGNLEKLLDFHSQFFLRELEACWKHPLRAPHCFLRHQEQFSLYALYSKNKPKSDSLLANHGHSFFRRKQVELGDKMDLSSYLLKPVQRMSKYALLLTDLMKEVGVAQEAELVALQAATNMVKFQLRHGNDLLAMDAIRNCDVNLKEQGQLIRQDEFTVWTGRRKCQRHVFLFEELVLFSKPKKMEGGLDVFIYKHSFKTADVGLTESTGDNGLRFEIWFRRRTTKNQTFILQAAAADIKHAWTSDIARILWTQATRNKEMRLKEMVSMGVGNKPFLDIQPSDAAISDRAVHYIMKSRGARTRASIAVSVFDHSNPFKRGTVTSDPSSSGPSSSSLLGPLNLHMYSQALPSSSSSSAAEGSFITSCIEEDEQEHETGSQPSMTTESSDSSSRCLSGSTGSDSGCVSSHLQEALPEESGPPGQPSCSSSSSSSSNKQHLNSQYISPKASPVIGPATIV
ncbi:puratrophin-1 isoform X4 [Thunnus thynnus]|uniref:puratrophin-1 isoform X4 n=1 Tax=Thunnus thynnus TaxID=8237 RepID=UPI0035280D91